MTNPFQFFDPKSNQIMTNSLGYEQLTTTLTAVGQKVSVQKLYDVEFSEYVPVVVGNGAFMSDMINWRTFIAGDDFETGIMNSGANKQALEHVDAAFDAVHQPLHAWAKGIRYSVFELEQAMRANNLFSLIEAREIARKKNWDLGLQKVAFLGTKGGDKGLLNQASVYVDSTNLTGKISGLSAADFNTFVAKIFGLYRQNCNYTAMPTHFVIPETDYLGLCSYPDATFTLKTKLELLTDAFKTITGNSNFKILRLAYADKVRFDGTNNRYVLLNYDPTSVKMDIPIDYTPTAFGTINGFNWENAAYGQFSGVVALREKEMYYFSNTAT